MNLYRFVQVLITTFFKAFTEVDEVAKQMHSKRLIPLQLRGLNRISTAQLYGVLNHAEAKAYLENPIIGQSLRTCTRARLRHVKTLSAEDILGADACKLRSCMTLFQQVAPEESLWADVLDGFFNGQADPLTLKLLAISSCE
jgi:uncharacterized protein (DUF1810 family)